MHCGFGFGVVSVNPALAALGWDPPRFMGDRVPERVDQPGDVEGDPGLDSDSTSTTRRTSSANASSTSCKATYGRRPEYCVPVVNRDLATVLLHAFADAHPLTPRGVKEALERVKMLPAASRRAGHPAVVRQVDPPGWMGAGYLVARQLDPDGVTLPSRRSVRSGVMTVAP